MKKAVIMIVDGSQTHCERLQEHLLSQEFEVVEASDQTTALRLWQFSYPALIVICSAGETTWSGLNLVRQIRATDKSIPLILVNHRSSEALAIAAIKLGVNDYFKWPIDYDQMLNSIKRNLRIPCSQTENAEMPAEQPCPDYVLVGNSQPMRGIKTYLPKVGATGCTVLITGQTGTGKECVARHIHQLSPRRKKSLVCVNCAALPDSLLESELFGFERGAFTGANSPYPGKLKLADGGSVFFDEIGDMSLYAQAKVLRVFENNEVTPLRANRSSTVDIRVIAATNHDLKVLVAENKFREDLYYRINVATIHLPPLRERKEDISLLIEHYIRVLNAEFHKDLEGFTDEALQCLLHYHWPGNVRELKNMLEGIFITQSSPIITLQDLPEFVRQSFHLADNSFDEKEVLLSALFSTNWNKSKTAKKLKWSRMTVYRKMEKYNICQSLEKPSNTIKVEKV